MHTSSQRSDLRAGCLFAGKATQGTMLFLRSGASRGRGLRTRAKSANRKGLTVAWLLPKDGRHKARGARGNVRHGQSGAGQAQSSHVLAARCLALTGTITTASVQQSTSTTSDVRRALSTVIVLTVMLRVGDARCDACPRMVNEPALRRHILLTEICVCGQ